MFWILFSINQYLLETDVSVLTSCVSVSPFSSFTYLFIKLYIFVYIGFDIYVLKLDLIVNDALSSETWLSGSCETCLNVKQGSQSAVIVLICVCAVLLLLLPFASFIDLFLVCPVSYLFTVFFSFFCYLLFFTYLVIQQSRKWSQIL